ncbi:MAG: hypothetical protein KDD33_13895, partial [Bdellovibrionales bacterium]|nr:hypothetical protein [Bdellovibrionales bacterium]
MVREFKWLSYNHCVGCRNFHGSKRKLNQQFSSYTFTENRLPPLIVPCTLPRNWTVSNLQTAKKAESYPAMANTIVQTTEEYEQFLKSAMPLLLNRASEYAKKILRETDQWKDNVSHEKLALRLGYELVERFLEYARHEIPCRPFLLLDSFVAKYFSQPNSFLYNDQAHTPLGIFIEGLTSRAVISRDALIAQFTHFYGLTSSQVIRLLGLSAEQSQRIYKNVTRWRQSGWLRTMKEIGLALPSITNLERQLQTEPDAINQKARDLLLQFQSHYRKSEPDHYPCHDAEKWEEMFVEGHGQDYRTWHLAMCLPCLKMVYGLKIEERAHSEPFDLKLQIQPMGLVSTL